ncbi:hypothetical protein CDV52_06605 [Haematobacter missouriensis]|uniref:RNA polymerase sigma-54 factor n=1 Tax=Haematobacter missouriensis TaxID=366616 RepID=A0A212AUF2_9RHOB|nr:hypothetical protein CDV53_13660 [Haematobacter missouriensis]OWJ85113.1 hypothetical protein CDV52_06605 [Haematobacter missouriensis]
MAVTPRLGLKQEQRLALTPGLRQSIGLLALPALGLMEALAAEAAENPFLIFRARRQESGGALYDLALGTVAAVRPLTEELTAQISMKALPPPLSRAALTLATHVGPDGYLEGEATALLTAAGQSAELAEAAVTVLKTCEPTGVGSRSFAEYLAARLEEDGIDQTTAHRIAALIATPTGGLRQRRALPSLPDLPPPLLKRVRALLRGLPNAPVGEASPDPLGPRLPDLRIVRQNDGSLLVERARPFALSLDTRLVRALRGGESVEARLAQARALIAAVEWRHATLLRIGKAILARQADFFHSGPDGLQPLTRITLAEELGLHPSTLGRAITAKSLIFGGRLLPLSMFFSSALPVTGGAESTSVSSAAVRQHLLRLIAAEPPQNPLSDAMLCDLLRGRGVDISRRTVAKYREGMRIPSSAQRRRSVRLTRMEESDGDRGKDHGEMNRRGARGFPSGA